MCTNGQLDNTDRVFAPYTDELLQISRQIQIIHEVSDPKVGFCNREFEQAYELLDGAERIFFLGFGFHPDNIRRFNFFSPEQIIDREIHATTCGMGTVEVSALASRLEPLGFKITEFNSSACNTFFTHVAALQ